MEPSSSSRTVSVEVVATNGGVVLRTHRLFTTARRLSEREKTRLREEIAQIPGLMALLMKPRNGMSWTRAERWQLRAQLRCLSHISVYVVLVTLPFTSLMLPLVAWWLDRRRQKRA